MDARDYVVLVFKLGELGRDQAQYHLLVADMRQRGEIAGAVGIVLQEEAS